MKTTLKSFRVAPLKRQGRLLAFSMTGAMAIALTSCNRSESGPTMIAPPNGFNTNQASNFTGTNQPPTTPYVHAGSAYGGYLGGHGYYPVYGYPNYYWRPAPGTRVEFVSGGSPSYSAGSPAEAHESIARGGFGASAGGFHGGFGGGS